MSFVQSHTDPAARAKAVIVVGGVHALLGFALVVGLTYTGVINSDEYDPIIEFTDPPETVPTDPVEQTDPVENYIPPTAPVDPLDLNDKVTDTVVPPDNAPIDRPIELIPTPLPTPTYAPDPPRPTASFAPVAASPRNGPAGWITNVDYPSGPLRRGAEGTAGYRLIIGSDGRVNDCQITASTGFAALDQATCRFLERRARFDPAKDQSGRTVVGSYAGRVTWEIPE